jgi:hypothetical protein
MMRGALVVAALAMMPWLAFAADAPVDADWHRCAADADCVLVPGICGQAAVNAGYKVKAAAYYAAQAKEEKKSCGDIFWKPKPKGARCHLESCELQVN